MKKFVSEVIYPMLSSAILCLLCTDGGASQSQDRQIFFFSMRSWETTVTRGDAESCAGLMKIFAFFPHLSRRTLVKKKTDVGVFARREQILVHVRKKLGLSLKDAGQRTVKKRLLGETVLGNICQGCPFSQFRPLAQSIGHDAKRVCAAHFTRPP